MKITEKAILQKVNRKKNPVSTLVGLANEFGVNTTFKRSNGTLGNRAPTSFRHRVAETVGHRTYNKIRSAKHVRTA